jgi:inosine-uridine nucleoside N-ribohydrolase
VILDTDIGTFMDDLWALALLLRSPELELKLALSATGDTVYRANLLAKMLGVADCGDVPVGIGIADPEARGGPQAAWVEHFDATSHPGGIHQDGVEALIETIQKADGPMTLIAIGPLTNVAAALTRAPVIAKKTRFVGMHGCIRRCQDGRLEAIPEYNVLKDIEACRTVFEAAWQDTIITPLDTCGQVRLKEVLYEKILSSNDPVLEAVVANYRILDKDHPDRESCILHDTVAVHLAHSTEFLDIQEMGVQVTDGGYTVRDDTGSTMRVAIDWKDLEGFQRHLTDRLTGR